MKFYKYLSLAVLFALTLAAGGCSQEDNFPDANGNMVINVYDAGMEAVGGNSRAVTDENYTTVFETGDCIGLFAIKDGAVWNNMNNKKDKEGVPLSGAPSLLFEGRLVKVSV